MTRWSRPLRGTTLMVGVAALLGSMVATGPGAGAIPASKCTKTITISALAFGPGTVVPGKSSSVRLSGMNCTRHAQSVTITWLGHYAGTGVTGCPAIDPLAQPMSVAASANVKAHLSYLVPSGCTAKSLVVTARITGAKGAAIDHKSASLRIAQPHTTHA